MGAIRDAKGKAVAAVFAELGGEQKAEVWIRPIVSVTQRIITKRRFADHQGVGYEDLRSEWHPLIVQRFTFLVFIDGLFIKTHVHDL